MTERGLDEINWRAAFVGFVVDWVFSELVGAVAIIIMLSLQGISLDSEADLPTDVVLIRQIIGIVGAVVGGITAGYLARQRGSLHGVLGSLIGLLSFSCSLLVLGGFALDVGDVGFIVLNLVGAGYGGGLGERWRARREAAG